jgi:hypothetical protein
MMRALEDYLLHPPAGSAAARAAQFGIDNLKNSIRVKGKD